MIGDDAFNQCMNLSSVTIGNNVAVFGDAVFSQCAKLKEFKGKFASDGGRCLIKDNTLVAYANASGYTYTIPNSVITIGNGAFKGCYYLGSITIPDSVTTIGDNAFYGCNVRDVTIPDSVTTIGDGAFIFCSKLKEFKGKFASDDGFCLIVNGVLNSFATACGATEYAITSGVTTIGNKGFYSCDSLTSVTIPDSVTTIGKNAFYGCTCLTSVYCKATTPPSLGGGYAFDYNASDRKIYVPAASVDAYKSAPNWSDYAADIVEYDF